MDLACDDPLRVVVDDVGTIVAGKQCKCYGTGSGAKKCTSEQCDWMESCNQQASRHCKWVYRDAVHADGAANIGDLLDK